MLKRIITKLASADKSSSRAAIANRVYQSVSVALQRVVAFVALEFRYTTLPRGRIGGGPQVAAQAAAEGGADWDADEVPEGQGQAAGAEEGVPVAAAPAPAGLLDDDQFQDEDVDMQAAEGAGPQGLAGQWQQGVAGGSVRGSGALAQAAAEGALFQGQPGSGRGV